MGLFLKFYDLLLEECADLDFKVAATKVQKEIQAVGDVTAADVSDFDQYVKTLQDARDHEKKAQELKDEAEQLQRLIIHLITVRNIEFSDTNQPPEIQQLMMHSQQLLKQAQQKASKQYHQ